MSLTGQQLSTQVCYGTACHTLPPWKLRFGAVQFSCVYDFLSCCLSLQMGLCLSASCTLSCAHHPCLLLLSCASVICLSVVCYFCPLTLCLLSISFALSVLLISSDYMFFLPVVHSTCTCFVSSATLTCWMTASLYVLWQSLVHYESDCYTCWPPQVLQEVVQANQQEGAGSP